VLRQELTDKNVGATQTMGFSGIPLCFFSGMCRDTIAIRYFYGFHFVFFFLISPDDILIAGGNKSRFTGLAPIVLLFEHCFHHQRTASSANAV